MLSVILCRKCWEKFVVAPWPCQTIEEVNKDGTGSTSWECTLPFNESRYITEKSAIPTDCLYKFEQAVYSGSVDIDKTKGDK